MAIYFFRRYFSRLFKYWSFQATTHRAKLKNFLLVNQDIFIRTMCLVVVFSIFTARSASSDVGSEGEETILAVNSLLMQFFMFFSFLIDGFAQAFPRDYHAGLFKKGGIFKDIVRKPEHIKTL